MDYSGGELKEFTVQDILNVLNDGIYDPSISGRYNIIRDLRVPTYSVDHIDVEKPEDCVVNIILWGRWQFYKWAYLSFLSSLLYTDIRDFKIRILIRKDQESTNKIDVARMMFEPLGAEVVEMDFKFKYSVVNKQKERYQIVLDSDSLMLGGKDKYPIFRNLYNLLKNDPGFYSAAPDDSWYSFQRFDICHEGTVLGEGNKTLKDFWSFDENLKIGEGVKLSDLLEEKKDKWTWNIFYGLDSDLFRGKSWDTHSKKCEKINWWDDEGCFQLYMWTKGVRIGFLKDLFGLDVPTRNAWDQSGFNVREKVPDVESFANSAFSYLDRDKESDFIILHPTNWSWMLDKDILKEVLYSIITESSKEFKLHSGPLLI